MILSDLGAIEVTRLCQHSLPPVRVRRERDCGLGATARPHTRCSVKAQASALHLLGVSQIPVDYKSLGICTFLFITFCDFKALFISGSLHLHVFIQEGDNNLIAIWFPL